MADISAAALPPKNHNNPPSDVEYLKENLELRNINLLVQLTEFEGFTKKIPANFTEQNEADFITDWISKVKKLQSTLEGQRKAEKEPLLRQGQFVDTFFGDHKNRAGVLIDLAMKPLDAYLQKRADTEKREREAEAELLRQEQQRAFEAVQALPAGSQGQAETVQAVEHLVTMTNVAAIAEKIAEAPVISMASSKGKFSKAGLVKKWVGTITSKADLDLNALRPYITDAALETAVNAYVKFGGRTLHGAKIEEITETKVK